MSLQPTAGLRFRYHGLLAQVTGHQKSIVGELVWFRYESGSWRARQGSTMSVAGWYRNVERGAIEEIAACQHDAGLDNLRPWPGQSFQIGECPKCKTTLSVPDSTVTPKPNNQHATQTTGVAR